MERELSPIPVPYIPSSLLLEIFLRLPSYSSLARCGLVCKEWRRLLVSPVGRRFFPALLLGFFHEEIYSRNPGFVPLTPSSAVDDPALSYIPTERNTYYYLALCRNGYVVLLDSRIDPFPNHDFVVCNPLTQQWVGLPPLPGDANDGFEFSLNSCVLLTDYDDHHPHHSPPSSSAFRFRFVVVFLTESYVGVRTFSSDAKKWGTAIRSDVPIQRLNDSIGDPVVINGVVYWLQKENLILAMHVDTCRLCLIEPPAGVYYVSRNIRLNNDILVAATEDGRLCVIELHGLHLSIWILGSEDGNGNGNGNGNAKWVMHEQVDLRKKIGPRVLSMIEKGWNSINLIAFGERSGALFLETKDKVFSFDLRSKTLKEVHQKSGCGCRFKNFHPYEIEWPH